MQEENGKKIVDVIETINGSEVTEVVTNFDKYMPLLIKFAWQLFVLILIWFIGKKVVNWIVKLLDKFTSKRKMDESVRKFLMILLRCIGYIILIFILLDYVGIGTTTVVAVLGSAGLAIGLALQGSLSNFAGGIVILMMKPFGIGDYIIADGVEGTVKVTGLIYTTILTVDNIQIVIPNGKLADSVIKNTSSCKKRRVIIKVGISYNSDLKKAKEVINELIINNEATLKNEEINIFVADLSSSSVDIETRFWVHTKDYLKAKWDMTEKIKLGLDDAKIEIPFNQLDVHLKQK